jgi:hypothetical protein
MVSRSGSYPAVLDLLPALSGVGFVRRDFLLVVLQKHELWLTRPAREKKDQIKLRMNMYGILDAARQTLSRDGKQNVAVKYAEKHILPHLICTIEIPMIRTPG